MSEITQKDIEIMNKQDDITLAQWNCLMNKWGWPEDLPDEPKDRDLPAFKWRANGRRSQLMKFIEERVGRRLVSWEWNKERMSLDEFNDFFAGSYEGDKKARARYEKWLLDRIEE